MKKIIASILSVLLLASFFTSNVNIPRKMESSVVLVRLKIQHTDKHGDKETGWGTCSGVFIEKNIILTAAHCVDFSEEKHFELKQIWVKKENESAQAFAVKVDPQADLALLYTSLNGKPVKFAKRAVRGEDCYVIGNPLGLVDIATKGIVSQINLGEKDEKATFLIVDAVALPGNSGGAIVNADGRLIGILTRGTSFLGFLGASGLGIGVDLKTITKFLK